MVEQTVIGSIASQVPRQQQQPQQPLVATAQPQPLQQQVRISPRVSLRLQCPLVNMHLDMRWPADDHDRSLGQGLKMATEPCLGAAIDVLGSKRKTA